MRQNLEEYEATIPVSEHIYISNPLYFRKELLRDDDACEQKLQAERTDFMAANKRLLMFWTTFMTPVLICYAMIYVF